jgi:hypothetical protein
MIKFKWFLAQLKAVYRIIPFGSYFSHKSGQGLRSESCFLRFRRCEDDLLCDCPSHLSFLVPHQKLWDVSHIYIVYLLRYRKAQFGGLGQQGGCDLVQVKALKFQLVNRTCWLHT